MAVNLLFRRSGETEYQSVPTKDGTTVEINKSINIEEQASNTTNEWSKTITVPATPDVNKLFSHIYDVKVYLSGATFNPNLKSDVLLCVDNLPFFQGFAQLLEVRCDLHGALEYDLACFGEAVNLISKLEPISLRQLDWSDLNHTFNSGNVFSTWESGNVTMGEGYVYPMIDYNGKQNNPALWQLSEFYPAVFLKEIWDRCFDYSGFKFESSFINSDRFKSFIMPYAGKFEVLSEADASGKLVSAKRATTAQTIAPSSDASGATKLIFNTEVQDNNNDYNNTTGAYDVSFNKFNVFFRALNCQAVCNVSGTYTSVQVLINAVRKRGTSWQDLGVQYTLSNQNGNGFALNAGQGLTVGVRVLIGRDQDGNIFQQQNDYTFSKVFDLSNVNGALQIGDELYYYVSRINAVSNGITYTDRFSFNLTVDSSIQFQAVQGGRQYGDLYRMQWNFPEDYKASTFLTDIIRMFNLVIYPKTNDEKTLIIEPYADFYEDTLTDWSDKLDLGQPIKSKPLSMSTSKSYLYSYKEGKDRLAKLHQDTYGRIYGTREKITENEFQKEQKKLQVSFIPSVLTNVAGTDRYITAAYELNGVTPKPSPGLRILIYKPEVITSNAYNVNVQGTNVEFDFYAYAGHLDNPSSPTFDLNFGITEAIYYAVGAQVNITNSNVYNVYHSPKINQLTNINSRVVTGIFKLTLPDIINLNFRNKFVFLGTTFRLLSIDGYQPEGDGMTPCTFITDEVREGDTIITVTSNGGSGTIGEEPLPGFNGDPSTGVVNVGSNNDIAPGALQGLVIGDNNTIGAVGRVTLINCNSVIIPSGLQNVTAIDCNDITITSNGVYQNNKLQPKQGVESFTMDSGNTEDTASDGVVNFIVSTDNTNCTLYIDRVEDAIYTLSYDHIDGSVLFIRDKFDIPVLDENTDGVYQFTYTGGSWIRLN